MEATESIQSNTRTRPRRIRTRSKQFTNTSTISRLYLPILLTLLYMLPLIVSGQSTNETIITPPNRIPPAPITDLYPFPALPAESQIFTTQTFCRATYTTCMEIFRDCLRVVGGISGANQICEQWRNDTCENGIRVGCDGIPRDEQRGSVAPSSFAFATGPAVGQSTATEESLPTETPAESTTTTEIPTTLTTVISTLPTTSPVPSSRNASASASAPTTVTVTTTLLVPTTLISVFTTTITTEATITTTQTLTNSMGTVTGTTTMTMTVQVVTAVPRGLTFQRNSAAASLRPCGRGLGWKYVLGAMGSALVMTIL